MPFNSPRTIPRTMGRFVVEFKKYSAKKLRIGRGNVGEWTMRFRGGESPRYFAMRLGAVFDANNRGNWHDPDDDSEIVFSERS